MRLSSQIINCGALLLLSACFSPTLQIANEAKRPAGSEVQAGDEIVVNHPLFRSSFSPNGLAITKGKTLNWHWQLSQIGAENFCSQAGNCESAKPQQRSSSLIVISRGGIDEEYHLNPVNIEQRFVLKSAPPPGIGDFIVKGTVHSNGRFKESNGVGTWSAGGEQIRYSKLFVYDANNTPLTSRLRLTATDVELIIDRTALQNAAYPVIIDPEIGTNDIRISSMGPDSNTAYHAIDSAVAYNSTGREYLVVWTGDDNSGGAIDNEYEIWGQRINAADGSLAGSRIRISNMGSDGSTSYDGVEPHVAYNSFNDEFLVVWSGADNSGSLVSGEYEIYGQRINASTGAEVGTDDFRISTVATDGDAARSAILPRVAYNAADNEYLVVWAADEMANEEYEIYGQRIAAATGAEVGTNDFRISDLGPDGNTSYGAARSDLAFNPVDNEYLVVFSGVDNSGSLAVGEFEVFAQRLSSDGTELGTNDMRISNMGPDGDASFDARLPAVAYGNDLFLITWVGDTNTGVRIDDEFEIHGQFFSATSHTEVGSSDFAISDMGPPSDTSFAAYPDFRSGVAYNSINREFIVVWMGTDNIAPLVVGEQEIFSQRISATTLAEIGTNDLRISDLGPDGNSSYDAYLTQVAYDSTSNRYFAIWDGDDNTGTLIDNEYEIFGQLIQPFSADITVSVDAAPSPGIAGNSLSYTLLMTNNGPDDHQGPLSMDFTMTSDVTYTGYSASGWSCTIIGSVLSCTRDSLPSGSSAIVTVTTTINSSVNGNIGAILSITPIVGTDPSGGNNFASLSTPASSDFDSDGVPDISDTDDDADNLNDTDETTYGTNPLDADSDDDSINDGQEVLDGSDPLDSGSFIAEIQTAFCSEWNGYLGGMWNILEFVNLSGSMRTVDTTLFSGNGAAQSTQSVPVLAGAQTDLLVHGMTGWTLNSYGKACSTHNGSAGDIDGRMVYYKPIAGGRYDFAFAMPLQNGLRGEQFVPFNTYQPSLDPADSSNFVANWIQLTNLETSPQTGTLHYYGQDGTELAQTSVSLGAESRQDFSGHQFGNNLVGTIRWVPASNSARFQLRNVRYYYDNPTLQERFDSAFQLEGMKGNGETLYAPLDTAEGSAILEVANTTAAAISVTATFYSAAGGFVESQTIPLPGYGSYHFIADSIVSRQLASAAISGTGGPGSVIATAMHYGRTASAGINWIYGIGATQTLGTTLRGSYNTFLNQSCDLILLSSDVTAHDSTISLTRYDGTVVLAGQAVTVPGHGALRVNLCSSESADNYGVVTVNPAVSNTVFANIVRRGTNDDYRFPTPVRQ